MIFESTRRRDAFTEGVEVVLADGQGWMLPHEPNLSEAYQGNLRRPAGPMDATDPELRQALRDAAEAESEVDARRCDLALAICLLRRNYELRPDELQGLLGFSADSDEGRDLRLQLRTLVAEAARRRAVPLNVRPEAPHHPGLRPSLQSWFGRLRRRYHQHPA